MNLFKLMAENECFKLVFSSSCTVYGLGNVPPYHENLSLGATNPYGKTKYWIEEMCRDLAISDKRWKISLLRYFNPIGAHKSGTMGEDPKGIPNNLLPFVSQTAIGQRSHVSVFGSDFETHDGTGVRDYIHVVDLARGHLASLVKGQLAQENGGCSAYNLGTGKGSSVLDIIKYMEKACGHPIPYKLVDRRAGDVAAAYASCDKAATELGWTATHSVEEGVADHWKWQESHPHGFASK